MVSEEAKENGFKETEEEVSSSVSPVMFSSMVVFIGGLEEEEEERVLEISRADTLHERERNSIGACGVSGGRNMEE